MPRDAFTAQVQAHADSWAVAEQQLIDNFVLQLAVSMAVTFPPLSMAFLTGLPSTGARPSLVSKHSSQTTVYLTSVIRLIGQSTGAHTPPDPARIQSALALGASAKQAAARSDNLLRDVNKLEVDLAHLMVADRWLAEQLENQPTEYLPLVSCAHTSKR